MKGTDDNEMVPLRAVGPASGSGPGQSPEAPPLPSEVELVARCQRGERRAFDELYMAYRRQVARNLYRILGPSSDLEDTLQDVFIQVFRSIGQFRSESKLSTWLYRLSANVALHRLRDLRRKEPRQAMLPEDLPGEDSPEEALARKQDLQCVHHLLEGLAPKKRMVFVLHEIEGLDVNEIADILGSPRITVRTRLHYARKEFYARAARDPGLERGGGAEGGGKTRSKDRTMTPGAVPVLDDSVDETGGSE